MPIYAYRCEACGFAKDVLQKVSDPQLTVCLQCGAPQFRKQVTAAGFQLKGTGWYATDFRNGAGTTAPAVGTGAASNAGGDAAGGKSAETADKSGAGKDAGSGGSGNASNASSSGSNTSSGSTSGTTGGSGTSSSTS